MDEKKIIRKVSSVGIVGNILLVMFKMYAGIVCKSTAMVSDAIHSLADVFASIVAFFGVKISRKEPDNIHPYGHDRFECIASLVLGLILVGTGCGIGYNGILTIIGGNYDAIETPTTIALVASIVSIVSKEAMFWYTRHYAKILNSTAFMADAWHQRSDALSSIGSLIGIAGSMMGYPVLDPIACVIICLCILKVGIDILKDSIEKMIDTSCGEEYEKEMSDFIKNQDGVDSVDVLHTRKFGNSVYIDVEITSDGNLTLKNAHEIAEKVHDAVENRDSNIKHVMVHQNPSL